MLIYASVTFQIIEFAGKSPDFVKGWPEEVSLHKLIPILEGKAIYISNILYVNKTYAMLKKRSPPTLSLTINSVNIDYSIYFLYINIK